MIKKLSAPKFYQQTDTFFLNPSSAKTFAYKLTSSSNLSIIGAGILDIVIGNIPNSHIGAYFTIANMLRNLYLNSVRDAILSYANKGKSVEVRLIKSNVKSTPIYYVGEWNGVAIKSNLINNSATKESVHFFKAK
ncbi:hypothetical protein QJR26_17800 (plasmid) [Clostridium baratii]